MTKEQRNQEIEKAIKVGNDALLALEKVDRYLGSARNWGILDMFGGDMIVSFIKRSKMNKAQRYIEEARMHLSLFQTELSNMQFETQQLPGFGAFAGFLDVFVDDFLVDLYVQSKIADARRKLAVTKEQVNQLLERLCDMKKVNTQAYIG